MGCSAGAKDSLKEFGSEQKEKEALKKKELLNIYKDRLEKSGLQGLSLILITTYSLKRASHDKVREKKERYVWLLKDSKDYDFSKEPYKTLRNLFKSELKNSFQGFFVCPEKVLPLHLYEDNEVCFKLFNEDEETQNEEIKNVENKEEKPLNTEEKGEENDEESEEEESLEYELSDSGVNCVVLFSLIDLEAIPMIKEIYEYSRKLPEEVFKAAFILNATVKDAENASKMRDTLSLLGLGKLDFKLLRKEQSYFERKLLDCSKQTSVLLYDPQRKLRFFDKISKFSLNEIDFLLQAHYYPLEKNSFKKLKQNVFDSFNSLMTKENYLKSCFSSKISMRKVKIFDSDLKLVKGYYELPRMYNKYKERETSLNDESLDFLRQQCGLISAATVKLIKKQEVSDSLKMPISLVINKFKLNNISFRLEVEENRRYYKYLDMNKEKQKTFSCFVSVNSEMYSEVVNIVADIMNVIRKVRIQVPIEYHALPSLGIKYRNTIKFFSTNVANKLELKANSLSPEILDLSNNNKIKILTVFSNELTCVYEFRNLLKKLETLRNNFSESVELVFVYVSDEMKSASELISSTFLKDVRIILAKGDSCNHLYLNSDYFQYYTLILSKDNILQYAGQAKYFDLVKSVEDYVKATNTEDLPILGSATQTLEREKFLKLKESFNRVVETSKKQIKAGKLLYQPILSFRSTLVEEYNNTNLFSSSYSDIKIKIAIKTQKFEDLNSTLDNFMGIFKSVFNQPFSLTNYSVLTLKAGKKCGECESALGKLYYYCDITEQYFCLDCEKAKNGSNSDESKVFPYNLILVKYDRPKVLEEIVETYYNINKQQKQSLDLEIYQGLVKVECLICNKELSSKAIIFLSLLHLCNEKMFEAKLEQGIEDDVNPVIFCEKCVKIIIEKDSRKIHELLKNSESNILSSDFDLHNFVLRKIIIC